MRVISMWILGSDFYICFCYVGYRLSNFNNAFALKQDYHSIMLAACDLQFSFVLVASVYFNLPKFMLMLVSSLKNVADPA
jgi:hypothetical protein